MQSKIPLFLAFSAPSAVFSDFSLMQHHYENTIRNRTSPSMANQILTEFSLTELSRYGCWCYFSEDVGKGRGVPVNQVDELCKILQQGYQCGMIDELEETSGKCTTWRQEYEFSQSGRSGGDVISDCYASNLGNECETRACIVEMSFVLAIISDISMGSFFDTSFRHGEETGFNPEEECVGVHKGEMDSIEAEVRKLEHLDVATRTGSFPALRRAPAEEEGRRMQLGCCGEYPERFPYSPLDGARECCATQTFDTSRYECCSDVVVLQGAC